MAEVTDRRRRSSAFMLLKALLAIAFVCSLPTGVQSTECPALPNQRQQGELELAAQKLLRVLRHGDIEALIRLLAHEVEIGVDTVVPRGKLARDLRKHKGITYAFLFDTPRYRADVEGWRKRFTAEQRAQMPPIESIRSIRDHLLDAQQIETSVCLLSETMGTERPLAVVAFNWPEAPTLWELPNSIFVLTRKGWRISMLFSARISK